MVLCERGVTMRCYSGRPKGASVVIFHSLYSTGVLTLISKISTLYLPVTFLCILCLIQAVFQHRRQALFTLHSVRIAALKLSEANGIKFNPSTDVSCLNPSFLVFLFETSRARCGTDVGLSRLGHQCADGIIGK